MSDVPNAWAMRLSQGKNTLLFIFCEKALESNFRLRSTYILKALSSTAETNASY